VSYYLLNNLLPLPPPPQKTWKRGNNTSGIFPLFHVFCGGGGRGRRLFNREEVIQWKRGLGE
jgi:hypothetical protein